MSSSYRSGYWVQGAQPRIASYSSAAEDRNRTYCLDFTRSEKRVQSDLARRHASLEAEPLFSHYIRYVAREADALRCPPASPLLAFIRRNQSLVAQQLRCDIHDDRVLEECVRRYERSASATEAYKANLASYKAQVMIYRAWLSSQPELALPPTSGLRPLSPPSVAANTHHIGGNLSGASLQGVLPPVEALSASKIPGLRMLPPIAAPSSHGRIADVRIGQSSSYANMNQVYDVIEVPDDDNDDSNDNDDENIDSNPDSYKSHRMINGVSAWTGPFPLPPTQLPGVESTLPVPDDKAGNRFSRQFILGFTTDTQPATHWPYSSDHMTWKSNITEYEPPVQVRRNMPAPSEIVQQQPPQLTPPQAHGDIPCHIRSNVPYHANGRGRLRSGNRGSDSRRVEQNQRNDRAAAGQLQRPGYHPAVTEPTREELERMRAARSARYQARSVQRRHILRGSH